MKIILSLIFLFFSHSSFAQFNTIQRGRNNYKVKVLGIEKKDESSKLDAIDSLKTPAKITESVKIDFLPNKYAKLSIDELRYLIKELESTLEKHAKSNKPLPKQIHKLYSGDSHHLNLQNLLVVMSELGLSNKLFVMAQAVLETGNFKSRVCREYNNLFGLYDSRNKDYFRFEKWEDSVAGYQKMIQRRYKGGNYLRFLKKVRYAEDPQYIPKVAKTAKWLYEENEHLFQTNSSVSS